MSKTGIFMGSAVLAIALAFSAPALAQDIDFGDDSSTWANDGQCDDPRFEGSGAATVRSPVDLGRDATDCRTALEAGTVTFIEATTGPAAPPARVTESKDGDIDFGDDSGSWANDGECDDPRFGGTLDSHVRADATDCRTAYEAGEVTYIEDASGAAAAPLDTGNIDFGDDTGSWANDGECDDPRFGGTLDSHRGKDATDCRAAYEAGEVTYVEGQSEPVAAGDIDFGDDSGSWANDGECDDPRFGGTLDSHRGKDATDCRTAYEAGEVTYLEGQSDPVTPGDIDFGDDSGSWANDGECDDPRFGGSLDSHRGKDATDCRTAYEAGEVTYLDDPSDPAAGDINFGDDSGSWANDGECDDPRFGGGLESHRLADATDCRTAFEAGDVSYIGDGGDDGDINFGDDSGTWANDGECDDPRFIGRGVGASLEDHLMADATDCHAAYERGTIALAPEDTASNDGGRINFGDDSGNWANDGECDDPRFTGAGVGVALDDHLMADATDCRTAYEAGTVTLASEDSGEDFRINFGDDSSASAFDGICDDPRFQGRGGASVLLDANLMADATDCRAAHDAGTVTYNP